MGSSNYLLSAIKPNLGEWQEVVLYMKGKSTGAATGLGTIENPRTFPAQAEFYAPMFIANYNFQTGICQLNYIIVEDNNSLASMMQQQLQMIYSKQQLTEQKLKLKEPLSLNQECRTQKQVF